MQDFQQWERHKLCVLVSFVPRLPFFPQFADERIEPLGSNSSSFPQLHVVKSGLELRVISPDAHALNHLTSLNHQVAFEEYSFYVTHGTRHSTYRVILNLPVTLLGSCISLDEEGIVQKG